MDELIFQESVFEAPETDKSFHLAEIGTSETDGFSLKFAGSSGPSEKHYKQIKIGSELSSGDRVVLVKISGTYLILGKIEEQTAGES